MPILNMCSFAWGHNQEFLFSHSQRIMAVEDRDVHILVIFVQTSLENIDACCIHNLLRQTVPIVSDPLSEEMLLYF